MTTMYAKRRGNRGAVYQTTDPATGASIKLVGNAQGIITITTPAEDAAANRFRLSKVVGPASKSKPAAPASAAGETPAESED